MQDLSLIEEAHAAKMLVVCLREGNIAKNVLYQILGKNTNVLQDRVKKLSDAGLLTETLEVDDRGYRRKIIALTPQGKQVAEHLQAIDEILQQ